MLPPIISESDFWGPLTAASVFLALLIVSGIVNVILKFVLRRLRQSAPGGLYIRILETLRGPIVLFIAISGLFLGLLILTSLKTPGFAVIAPLDPWIRKVWLVVVIAEVAYLIYNMLDALMVWYIRSMASRTSTKMDDRLLPPLRRLLPLLVYSVAGLMALSALNIPISPIWAGLGIGGLAVALAVQPTLANFFAGTYVVTEGELNIGDYIELAEGPAGYVTEVGWRSTKIRTMFNNLVIIPNSKMAESIVTNYYSPTPAMDVLVYCGVSYDSDLDLVENVVVDASARLVNESRHAIKGVAPWFGFEEFGDSNITFWVFIRATDRLASFGLTSELVKTIRKSLREESIEINYPVRKLMFPPTNGQSTPVMPENRAN